MKKLRAKLYSLQLEKETSKRYNARKIQVKLNFLKCFERIKIVLDYPVLISIKIISLYLSKLKYNSYHSTKGLFYSNLITHLHFFVIQRCLSQTFQQSYLKKIYQIPVHFESFQNYGRKLERKLNLTFFLFGS